MDTVAKREFSALNASKRTTIMRDDSSLAKPPSARLLYADYGESGKNASNKRESHDFWQMELVLDGSIALFLDASPTILEEKAICVIPPGVEHLFSYTGLRRTWSFKFAVDAEFPSSPTVFHSADSNQESVKKVCGLFFSLLEGYRQVPDSLAPAIEALIGGLLALIYPASSSSNLPEWVLKAKEFILLKAAARINLEDLAEHMQYSHGHLCRLCQTSLGMSLKEFFDNEKAALAKKKLLYSSKTVSVIADELGFNNVYSFSRFFKRVTGLSPSEFRKQNFAGT